MKAIGKYIVIDPVKETSTKTKGGLILGEKDREDIRYRQAKVIVVGGAVEGLKIGDNIYYDKSAGFKVEIKNKTWQVIKENDVVIVL